MIVVQITGGLGNQMFQYAAGKALAMRWGQPLCLDITSYDHTVQHHGFELSHVFQCKPEIIDDQRLREIFGYKLGGYVRKITTHPRLSFLASKDTISESSLKNGIFSIPRLSDAYLVGYWQSESYFNDFESLIRRDFLFTDQKNADASSIVDQISACESVGVHIRRGDYVSNKSANSFHGLIPLDYYRDAVARISQKIQNPQFFIFSDDIDWCRNNFKINFPAHFVDVNVGAQSYNDMRLMSLCKNIIIANSSFSWWSAWLNQNPRKIVFAPIHWFSGARSSINIVPEAWIRI